MAEIITRQEAGALIAPDETKEIIQSVVEQSTVLNTATRLRDMTSNEYEYPIMESYPLAGFVDGDTGLKMTTSMKWSKKKIVAGEVAAILPVPDNVVADSSYNIFEQVKPRLIEAVGRVIDRAVFFGDDKPNAWREGLLQGAIAAGNTASSTEDIYKDILGVNGVVAKVEEDGYFPNGVISAITMRARLRDLRDTANRPIFVEDMKGTTPYALGGMSMFFPRNGVFNGDDAKKVLMIIGDFNNLVYSIRQAITFDVFDSGVISDENGKVIYNLMQNDMKAIRMVIRLGWEIFNPLNAIEPNETKRFPFAAYVPANP